MHHFHGLPGYSNVRSRTEQKSLNAIREALKVMVVERLAMRLGKTYCPSATLRSGVANFRPCILNGSPGVKGRCRVLVMEGRVGMFKSMGWLVLVLCAAASGYSQGATANRQTETDEYTRYELLSPESASFAIRYEVTATTAGAEYYFNPIRKGSTAI